MGRIHPERVETFLRIDLAGIDIQKAAELRTEVRCDRSQVRRTVRLLRRSGLAQVGEQPFGSVLEAGAIAGRKDDGFRSGSGPAGPATSLRFAPFLQDHMRIGTAGAEGRYAGAARSVRDPGGRVPLQDERRFRQIDVRIAPFRMQARHQYAVLHLQHGLGQSGDSGGGFQMTD